jgi:hypothetical protein
MTGQRRWHGPSARRRATAEGLARPLALWRAAGGLARRQSPRGAERGVVGTAGQGYGTEGIDWTCIELCLAGAGPVSFQACMEACGWEEVFADPIRTWKPKPKPHPDCGAGTECSSEFDCPAPQKCRFINLDPPCGYCLPLLGGDGDDSHDPGPQF